MLLPKLCHITTLHFLPLVQETVKQKPRWGVALLMEVSSGGDHLHCVQKKSARRGYHKRSNNAKGSTVVIISGS